MKPLSSPTFIGLKLYPLDLADNQEEKLKKIKKIVRSCTNLTGVPLAAGCSLQLFANHTLWL
ncbi:MAG: hypothetical protein M3015_01230 [Bacteroidota bacterium]|nr:hypothetical protein [Bacteroidota bacterium]